MDHLLQVFEIHPQDLPHVTEIILPIRGAAAGKNVVAIQKATGRARRLPNGKSKVVRPRPKRMNLFSGFPRQVSRTGFQLCRGVFMGLACLVRLQLVSGPFGFPQQPNPLLWRSLAMLLSVAASRQGGHGGSSTHSQGGRTTGAQKPAQATWRLTGDPQPCVVKNGAWEAGPERERAQGHLDHRLISWASAPRCGSTAMHHPRWLSSFLQASRAGWSNIPSSAVARLRQLMEYWPPTAPMTCHHTGCRRDLRAAESRR